MNPSALVITLFACALLSVTEGLLIPQPRCRCTETVSKEIPYHRIINIETFPPGPHCKNTEIIATVNLRKVVKLCINPKAEWVQNVLKKRKMAS
ncbi:hypothetical protein KOW79_006668 [Hemibagrus wyckioides]|uniref:Chemokine interleukin-8-like domain-containing protein n=1 Tax=Hemibagrus wyckioides TaxID=337641 RepID=A0A9D3NWA8_9TELE|nr:interleukin-8-like [Hemibagrus wyckioides]KAG7330446.1 hypothetical protein KOW79_006668 [Hemibagrus wyckioides]